MIYLFSLGLVGAAAQTIELGIHASSTAAMDPSNVLPKRLPAMIVSLSYTRIPFVSQHKYFSGDTAYSDLHFGQMRSRLASKNDCC